MCGSVVYLPPYSSLHGNRKPRSSLIFGGGGTRVWGLSAPFSSIFDQTGLIIGPPEAKNAQEVDFHVKTSLALQKPGEKCEIWCEMKNEKNFKWPKNREDKSDLDENLTEKFAAMKSIIWKIFRAAWLQKNCFQNVEHASRDPRGRWHGGAA